MSVECIRFRQVETQRVIGSARSVAQTVTTSTIGALRRVRSNAESFLNDDSGSGNEGAVIAVVAGIGLLLVLRNCGLEPSSSISSSMPSGRCPDIDSAVTQIATSIRRLGETSKQAILDNDLPGDCAKGAKETIWGLARDVAAGR